MRLLIDSFRRWRQQLPPSCGPNHTIDPTVYFAFPERISLGNYIHMGPRCLINGEGGIEIGDGTIFGGFVTVFAHTHRYRQSDMLPYNFEMEYRKVVIGSGVWIGNGAMVVPGVSIGDGAVIGMGAVVTQNVEKGQVVGGNPAKEIAPRRDPQVIDRLVSENAYFERRQIETQEKFDNGLQH